MEFVTLKGRLACLIIKVLFVLGSLLTALRVVPGPDIAGVVLAFYTLFILPGALMHRMLFGPVEASPAGVCRLFSTGLLFVSILVFAGFVPGVSYAILSVMATCVTLFLLFLDHFRWRCGTKHLDKPAISVFPASRGRDSGWTMGRFALVILVFALSFVFFHGAGELGWSTDSLDHLSFIRRCIDSGSIFPNDSFFKSGDGTVLDPRKGLWHSVIALLTFQSDAAPEYVWSMLPSMLVFFSVTAFIFFSTELLGSVPLASLALVFIFVFQRGEGVRWFTKIQYSRNIVQVIVWIEAALLFRYLWRRNGKRDCVLMFLLSFAGMAYHFVYALLIGTVMAALLIYTSFVPSGKRLRGRFWMAALVQAAALLVPLLLRARFTLSGFNPIHTHRQGMLLLSNHFAIVDPVEIVVRIGYVFFFVLVTVPFFSRIGAHNRNSGLLMTLVLFPVCLVLNPLTAAYLERYLGYLHFRMLYAAPLICAAAVGVTGLARILVLGRSGERMAGSGSCASVKGTDGPHVRAGIRGNAGESRTDRAIGLALEVGKRLLAAVLLLLFVFLPLRFSLARSYVYLKEVLFEKTKPDRRYEILFERLDREIPAHSVVVTDPLNSYVLSAYTDHFVAVVLDQHGSPSDTMALERIAGVRDLLCPAVPLSRSAGWLKRVGADYVLIDSRLPERSDFYGTAIPGGVEIAGEKLRSCHGLARELFSFDGFTLYRIVKYVPGTGDSLAYDMRYAAPLPCAAPAGIDSLGFDTGMGIVLEGIRFEERKVCAGDMLTGFFCWKRSGEIEFGLPVEWTVRLDTGFPMGAWYRPWYGKQYRRHIESRSGKRYRFSASGLLLSGYTFPDQWDASGAVRQDFSFPLPPSLSPGMYEFRVTVRRLTYLPNRRISDYLRNEDLYYGEPVGLIHVESRGRR